MVVPEQFFLKDSGVFPNSKFPVLLYKDAVKLPLVFPAATVKTLFSKNGWGNNWRDGIYTFNHYHSVTHEVLCILKGQTTLQLGGDEGVRLSVGPGDVIIIPAGVAHKNLGGEDDVICVGGYPGGRDFDMNYGKPEERPQADYNIAVLDIPATDPILGREGLTTIWSRYE